MAKPKTTSPVSANGKAHDITFPNAEIAEFGRIDATSGWIKWKCGLGRGMEALFDHMGWSMPGEKTTQDSFETKLAGGHFILTAKDKLVQAGLDIMYLQITGFACHRFEIKGGKKKGFRRELRFTMSFSEAGAAGKIESYEELAGVEGSLKITYYPEEVQTEMDLSEPSIA